MTEFTSEKVIKITRLFEYLIELERLEVELYIYRNETGDFLCEKMSGYLQRRNEVVNKILNNFGDAPKLRAENEKLREALREIANSAGEDACGFTTGEGHSDCVWKARKILKEVMK
jgi:hypothetical protein